MSWFDDEEEEKVDQTDFTPPVEQSKSPETGYQMEFKEKTTAALTGDVNYIYRLIKDLDGKVDRGLDTVWQGLVEKMATIDPKVKEESTFNAQAEIKSLKDELQRIRKEGEEYRETIALELRKLTMVLTAIREEMQELKAPAPQISAPGIVQS